MNTVDAVGINLGTRNAFCAYAGADKNISPVVIPNRWGRTSTPSIVAWDEDWLVGEDAVRLFLRGSGSVWWNVKREAESDFVTSCGNVRYKAQDVLTPLLRALREDADVYLGRFVSSCVLAVPECFSPLQREAMIQAAETAGITNVRVVSEPVAAAFAFGREGRFLILDFGAGVADISVVESNGSAWQILESLDGAKIGGCDFDLALAEWLQERLRLDRMSEDDPRWRTLILEAEAIKIALSSCLAYDWKPPSLACREFPVLRIEREELERMTRFSLRRLLNLVRRLWDKHQPECLLLVGGSSRIPLLREILEQEIARPERLSLGAEESIAIGAALYAVAGGELLRTESAPYEKIPGEPLAPGGHMKDLKMRLALIEPSLNPAQKMRLNLMADKLGNLENDASAVEILERVVKDLEAEFIEKATPKE